MPGIGQQVSDLATDKQPYGMGKVKITELRIIPDGPINVTYQLGEEREEDGAFVADRGLNVMSLSIPADEVDQYLTGTGNLRPGAILRAVKTDAESKAESGPVS